VIASRIAGDVAVLVTAALTISEALFTLSSNGPSIFVFKPAASSVVSCGMAKAATRMEFAAAVNSFEDSFVAFQPKQTIAG
jgi:hypothetical protein